MSTKKTVKKPVPEKIRNYRLAIVQEMLKLATSAFGLIAALAWNELIRSLIEEFVKKNLSVGSQMLSLVIYAVTVTCLAVFVTIQLSKLADRLQYKS